MPHCFLLCNKPPTVLLQLDKYNISKPKMQIAQTHYFANQAFLIMQITISLNSFFFFPGVKGVCLISALNLELFARWVLCQECQFLKLFSIETIFNNTAAVFRKLFRLVKCFSIPFLSRVNPVRNAERDMNVLITVER